MGNENPFICLCLHTHIILYINPLTFGHLKILSQIFHQCLEIKTVAQSHVTMHTLKTKISIHNELCVNSSRDIRGNYVGMQRFSISADNFPLHRIVCHSGQRGRFYGWENEWGSNYL